MGTTDLFVFYGLVSHMIDSNKKLFCAFIDFSKAFDYVAREKLWMNSVHIGIRGNMLNIIQSMYNNVKSRVKYLNQLNDCFECYLGVRQSKCLSPFLLAML